MSTYLHNGRQFSFNDHVVMELTFQPIEKCTGRLVQVRKGVGAFGSDQYFLRLRDGSLMVWSNVLMRKVDDKEFEENFYRLGARREPPVIPDQETFPSDSEDAEYSIHGGEWPETGFLIEKPKQPEEGGAFSMIITKR